ncbi:MAG: dTDP-4-dehydrorhamnose 3,5-epimerase [Reyranellaceae bacterium]
MDVKGTPIQGVKLVALKRFNDERGWFEESYREDVLTEAGISDTFVQENMSFSADPGIVRGLHFQAPPASQAKLVRVLQGSILDVVVDLRRSSATFGRHFAVRLDAVQAQMLYVPIGLAHGFCTLEANTVVTYKVSSYYAPALERRLLWNDPALGIDWPSWEKEPILSAKDKVAPPFSDIEQFP